MHTVQESFNLIIVSSTYLEHPSVRLQEDMYMYMCMAFLSCIHTRSAVDGSIDHNPRLPLPSEEQRASVVQGSVCQSPSGKKPIA